MNAWKENKKGDYHYKCHIASQKLDKDIIVSIH